VKHAADISSTTQPTKGKDNKDICYPAHHHFIITLHHSTAPNLTEQHMSCSLTGCKNIQKTN
jgi:hypothetical protein